MGVNSLPKTVTQQRFDCDLNLGPSAPESSTLTTRLSSHATVLIADDNLRNPRTGVTLYLLFELVTGTTTSRSMIIIMHRSHCMRVTHPPHYNLSLLPDRERRVCRKLYQNNTINLFFLNCNLPFANFRP